MTENLQTTPTSYPPIQPAMPVANQMAPAPSPKKSKKFLGVDKRALLTVVGLTSFIVLAMAGVYIASIQRINKGSVAPTAPESKPQAAAEQQKKCTYSFVVTEDIVLTPGLSCSKKSFQDEFANAAGSYQTLQEKSTFKPGDTVVFQVAANNSGQTDFSTVTLSDLFTGGNMDKFTFLDSSCGASAYDSATKTLTCATQNLTAGTSVNITFRAKLAAAIADGTTITNTATLSDGATPATTASCQKPITVSLIPVLNCNDSCGTGVTGTCPNDHTCDTTTNKCVLTSCLATGAQCDTTKCALLNPTPTPTVTCGETCGTNALCPTDHICNATTNKCVLAVCLNTGVNCDSNNCNVVGTTPTPTPTPTVVSCGDDCSSNSQCPSDHVCTGGKCVYDECLRTDVTCSSNRCVIVYTYPTPTPAAPVGCNNTCSANADCADPNHICWYGNCRLGTNPNSTSCTNPPADYVPTKGGTVAVTNTTTKQPTMPAKLPETGILDEGLKIVGAGAAAVILGGLLLFLL